MVSPSSRTRTQLEIERKYLLRGVPAIPAGAERWHIAQGYFPRSLWRVVLGKPKGRLRTITFDDGSAKCFHTIKQGSGLVRREREFELTQSEFAKLWPQTKGRRLTKTRHRVPVDGLVWEVDVFEGMEIVLAEVELPNADLQPRIPGWLEPWIVREVTSDPAFTNAAIAVQKSRK